MPLTIERHVVTGFVNPHVREVIDGLESAPLCAVDGVRLQSSALKFCLAIPNNCVSFARVSLPTAYPVRVAGPHQDSDAGF